MKRYLYLIISVLMVSTLFGCKAHIAHKYSYRKPEVPVAINFEEKLSVGDFSIATVEVDKPTVRLGEMSSPYEKSFSAYLERALKIELIEVNRFDPGSDYVLYGQFIENSITSPVSESGVITLSARFIVKKDEKVLFDEVITHKKEWDVPFAGDDARNMASGEYVKTMREFIKIVLGKLTIKSA